MESSIDTTGLKGYYSDLVRHLGKCPLSLVAHPPLCTADMLRSLLSTAVPRGRVLLTDVNAFSCS